jgi:ATP-dependent Clp protease ATP-binding subunit ClpC
MGVDMVFDDSAVALLAEEGYDESYGARPLRRAIQTKVEDKFAEDFLTGKFEGRSNINVSADNGEIIF